MASTGDGSPVGEITHPGMRRNIFSFVVRRTSGEWRCASAHNTDIVPHMETNIVDNEGRFTAVDYRRRWRSGISITLPASIPSRPSCWTR